MKKPIRMPMVMKLPAIIKTVIQLGLCATSVATGCVAAQSVSLLTPQGALVGETSSRSANIAVFRHIPYALPPVGERRWRHARVAPGWNGERLATQFSPACLQPGYPKESFYARPAVPSSEDCLYLNVWTPLQLVTPVAKNGAQADAKKIFGQPRGASADAEVAQPTKLPVMVWIHGGALTRGSGANPIYDGTNLAGKDVVLVTINYRLGVFGYMAHPEASAESAFGVSGNTRHLIRSRRYSGFKTTSRLLAETRTTSLSLVSLQAPGVFTT